MRAALLCIALAACAPDIVSGAYLCGPDMACPDSYVCNGSDNSCVLPSRAMAFACTNEQEAHEPDDTSAQAAAIPMLGCVSTPFTQAGCLATGDTNDWFAFDAPDACAAVEAVARMYFPVAYEPLTFELWDLTGNMQVATGGMCKQADVAGTASTCFTYTLTGGHHYGVLVKPAGGGDCDGKCAFNRYSLSLQLQTPG